MSGKMQLEKWLSAFFDRVESTPLTKGQHLFNEGRVFGFEEGPSQVEAMVRDSQIYKVTVYYNEEDLMELGLPLPKKIICTCSCQADVKICEHSLCTVLHWAFQTEKTLRSIVQLPKMAGAGAPMKSDLTLKRLENASHNLPGPFDHVLKGFGGSHPLDGLMRDVFKKLSRR